MPQLYRYWLLSWTGNPQHNGDMNAKAMKLLGTLTTTNGTRRRDVTSSLARDERPSNVSSQAVDFVLKRGECLSIQGSCRLTCRVGEAWLTYEGDIDDHFLIAGLSTTLPQRGRSVIQALSPCRLTITR
jgi:hypothetical protein